MSLVNLANNIDDTKAANATLSFDSGTVIGPDASGRKIFYPIWHGAVNPFLHDFREYAKFLQKQLESNKFDINSELARSCCMIEDGIIVELKFEIVPDMCEYVYKPCAEDKLNAESWLEFIRLWRGAIGRYMLMTIPEAQQVCDSDFLNQETDINTILAVCYVVKYKIEMIDTMFKREDCEHGIDEVFINYANERHPYAVAIKTSTNNVKVFESSELSPIDKGFIVDDAIVVEYEEILEKQFPIVKWKDIIAQYPDKWILYANSTKDSESGATLYTLIDVCAESDVEYHMLSLIDKGYPVAALKVTSTMVGVMV